MLKSGGQGPVKAVSARQGSILIGVLWALFFLTALALVINTVIAPQLTLAGTLRDRLVLRNLAEAGMKRAVIALRNDATGEYDALSDDWAVDDEAFKEIFLTDTGYFSVEYSVSGAEGQESRVRYGLADEERKINVTTAPSEVLARVLAAAGDVSDQEAAEIIEAVLDWQDADDEKRDSGAESDYYEGLERPYPCKNGNFEALEELLLVKGMTRDLFDGIKDHLTVYGNGGVNINTADAGTLALLGMDEDLAGRIVRHRNGNDGEAGTDDDNVFESAQSFVADLSARISLSANDVAALTAIVDAGLIGVRSDYFRGRAYGRFADSRQSYEIVFVIGRNEAVHFWKEM